MTAVSLFKACDGTVCSVHIRIAVAVAVASYFLEIKEMMVSLYTMRILFLFQCTNQVQVEMGQHPTLSPGLYYARQTPASYYRQT